MECAGYREAITFVIVAVLFTALVKVTNKTDIATIENLPELPGVPFFGSLFLLGRHHARNCARLAKDYGDVFQARLGNRRFIYANSFESVRALWIKNQSALVSRPKLWTFHDIVSAQGVFTLGTSPWSDSVKRARKAAATALNRQATQTYLPFIDLESTTSINELLRNLKHDNNIDPNGYFQRFSLNMSLTLTYGIRLDGTARSHDLLNEVVTVERELANFRGIAHNWQDYVPLLRLWPGLKKRAIKFRGRRDDYILSFFQRLKDRVAKGTDKPCIAGNVLKDPEAKLSDNELKSICLTMVAAGLDTLPGNITMTIAYLSSEHGQAIQKKLHEELVKAHAGEDPWHECLAEEKSEYMRSFVKEVLRFWSTLNMSFNRESTKPIVYEGATIPAGTPFLLNMWAANHDPKHFSHPMDFYPERFMGVDETGAGTQHYGYGAGTRMCAGVHLANRELYAIFSRLVLAFRILPTDDIKSRPILDTIECNSVPTSMVTQPKPFKVRFIPRSEKQLETWITKSFQATEHL